MCSTFLSGRKGELRSELLVCRRKTAVNTLFHDCLLVEMAERLFRFPPIFARSALIIPNRISLPKMLSHVHDKSERKVNQNRRPEGDKRRVDKKYPDAGG